MLARIVINDLTDGGESDLKKFFSEDALENTPDIDEQIIIAEEFLKDVEPDIDYILDGGEEWIDYGKLTMSRKSINMKFIDKETGDNYRMNIVMYKVNDEDPSKEGIEIIIIMRELDEEDEEKVTIGVFEDE
jgi:hypothetical protein